MEMEIEEYVCSLLLSSCGHGSSCHGKWSDDDEVLSSLEERASESSEEDSISLTKVRTASRLTGFLIPIATSKLEIQEEKKK